MDKSEELQTRAQRLGECIWPVVSQLGDKLPDGYQLLATGPVTKQRGLLPRRVVLAYRPQDASYVVWTQSWLWSEASPTPTAELTAVLPALRLPLYQRHGVASVAHGNYFRSGEYAQAVSSFAARVLKLTQGLYDELFPETVALATDIQCNILSTGESKHG